MQEPAALLVAAGANVFTASRRLLRHAQDDRAGRRGPPARTGKTGAGSRLPAGTDRVENAEADRQHRQLIACGGGSSSTRTFLRSSPPPRRAGGREDAPDGIEVQPLFDDPLRVVLPVDYPLADHPAVSVAGLAEDTWIRPHDGSAARRLDSVLAAQASMQGCSWLDAETSPSRSRLWPPAAGVSPSPII